MLKSSNVASRGRLLALVLFAVTVVPPPAVGSPLTSSLFAVQTQIRERGDRVQLFGDVEVPPNEIVDGDVVSIGGDVRVDGQIDGDTVVVLGSLALGPSARVRDVTVVGGRLERAPGAEVRGELNHVGFGGAPRMRVDWDDGAGWNWGARRGPALAWTIFRFLILAGLVALVALLAPAQVRNIGDRAARDPLKAGLLGLAIELLLVPVTLAITIVLVVSIVGIPLLLLLPLAFLVLVVVFLVGFAGLAYRIGDWIQGRLGWSRAGVTRAAVVGVLTILLLAVTGRLVALGGGLFAFFAAILLAGGFLLEFLAWTVGLGAVVLSWFDPPAGPSTPALPPSPQPPPAGPASPGPAAPPGPPRSVPPASEFPVSPSPFPPPPGGTIISPPPASPPPPATPSDPVGIQPPSEPDRPEPTGSDLPPGDDSRLSGEDTPGGHRGQG